MTVYAPTSARRPPLWLAAAAVASGWATVYSIASWIASNVVGGWVHFDVRMYYVAAEAGVRYGWSTIYDQTILRSLSTSFPDGQRLIDSQITFASPPLLAWLFVPLTLFPEPVAYALWTALSLAALVFAWYIAAPYTGLAKLTLLLVALGLTPVFGSLFLGQPIMIVIGFLGAAWWLCAREQPLAAGAALAFATFLKPQAVILVPAALLVSGRYRVVASWAAGCAALGVASALTLGPSGLLGWWHATRGVQNLPLNTDFTLAYFLGTRPLTYALWVVQGATALWVARRRRRELEIVVAVGVIGTAATASYFHEWDYSTLVLAAWLVLRTSPPLWHRLWLLVGILSMLLLDYTGDYVHINGPWQAPQLIWDAAWLGILLVSSFAEDSTVGSNRARCAAPTSPPATNS